MQFTTKKLFSKEEFLVLKGVAILLMLIHHLFTYPGWYVAGISYQYSDVFAGYFCWSTKICVGIFAFLTGYAYVYNETPDYRYAWKKIKVFLSNYWIVYIPILLLSMLGGYQFDWKDFVLGLFGLSTNVMTFCWYVYFYLILMGVRT